MSLVKYTSRWGFRDGLSIAFAYFPVAFAFGLFAVAEGLRPWQAVLISMLNVTSAGQFASIPIFIGTGSYIEMLLTQFMINLRYALTSITLSQKLDSNVKLLDRFASIDEHLRRQIRVIIWKQWKVATKRLWGLLKLGVPKWIAQKTANWGDHYQFIATKSVLARAISKEKLTKRGLVSLSDYYLKVAHI